MRTLRFSMTSLMVFALLAVGFRFQAQGNLYSPNQIDQMVAPIALYPDALMSQVLMAATYPDQVSEADQWIQDNPDLTGSAMDDALATATWDPSIIALCKFPTVLDKMAQNIKWTTDLGNGFMNQKTDVFNAVQTLRTAAYRDGHLKTSPRQRVVVENKTIVIQPYTPDVIYVPTYNPVVVYGPVWSYPSYYYPSVWAPSPGVSFVNGFAWGVGLAAGNALFGGLDWSRNDVYVNNSVIVNNRIYRNTNYYRHGNFHGSLGRQAWARHGGKSYGHGHRMWHGPGGYSGHGHARRAAQRHNHPGMHGHGRRAAQRHSHPGMHGHSRPAIHGPAGWKGKSRRAAQHQGRRAEQHQGRRAEQHQGRRAAQHQGRRAEQHQGRRAAQHQGRRAEQHQGRRAEQHQGRRAGQHQGRRAGHHGHKHHKHHKHH